MTKKTPPEIIALLRKLKSEFEIEDTIVRERQIRTWRRLKLFWEGLHRTWYSETAHDWRIWDQETVIDDTQQDYYDKPINVFRAYIESIIAALSVVVPPVKCYPDDADNNLDLQTAKAGDRIAKLLYRHNDAPLLWIHALFIYCTEGMVGCYTYAKEDESYGTYENKKYQDTTEEHQYARCPTCGYNLSDEVTNSPEAQQFKDKMEQNEDKFAPTDDDIPIQDYINDEGTDLCPQCAQQIIPLIVKENLVVTRLIGITNEPKSRICMEAYGGLNIKVPCWARTQADCPYLRFSYETHYSNAIERYGELDGKELRDKIRKMEGGRSPLNEEWARLSPQYNGEYPTSVVTVNNWWFRPSAFNSLDDEDAKRLKDLFPNGCHATFVNDEFAEACNEAMDDCWTLTYNPLSDYIHFDPLGLLLTSIQELTNDLISLTTQTIEHGIGQTFVDPETLNFDAYRQLEATPGGVYEAKTKSGKQSLGDSFYEVKTASLSGEVLPFFNNLQSLGQLVSGALPSLFGGAVQGGGTASEYSMSRAQALQRLQNTWKMLTSWWKNIYGKAIPAFIEETQEDERMVERTKDGNFINVFIRKSELEGKIGRVELEANENLPMTWSQRKDVIMQLLQTGIPEVLQIIGAPENLPIIREAIGLDDFFVPDEDNVEKVYDDIHQLLNSTPIQDPMAGNEMPSIEVDPTFDNPVIGFEIVRKWVISEAGRLAKIDNQAGYRNVLLYGQQYKMLQVQSQMQQQLMAPQDNGSGGAAPNEKPNKDTRAPIKGENDVPSVQ
jgi:hypothetical protein